MIDLYVNPITNRIYNVQRYLNLQNRVINHNAKKNDINVVSRDTYVINK